MILRKISLRTRITLLTGAVILSVSLLLTFFSMHNADERLLSISQAPELNQAILYSDTDSSVPSIQIEASAAATVPDAAPDEQLLVAISTVTVAARQEFNVRSLFALAFISAGGMLAAWLLAGRALRPVRLLEAAVSDITAHNMAARLPVPAAQDEIGRLTASFNAMLDRLAYSFEQQKRFSSSVAHELKTPLATMKMSLQVAKMEGNELGAVTERSVDRLIGVVNSLLDLTNETVEAMDDEIALAPLLCELAGELRPLYADKKLKIICDADTGLPPVLGNAPLARRLLGNLIENAMKYNMPDGTVTLCAARDGDTIRVSVSDTGPGIPADALDRVFEPFYCVDPSRSRSFGGAGLGLSIARAIAERHGWTLTAENLPDGGAAFTVRIPWPCC